MSLQFRLKPWPELLSSHCPVTTAQSPLVNRATLLGCVCESSTYTWLLQVGRTARQGQSGQVTSLYSLERKPLAEAVKAAIEADMPVEGAFSRNRSFSKKIRKYGQYVPRGQAGPST